MYPGHHWGDWNDSQLLPTIQKLMKGYNRYLRPNFNGRDELEMQYSVREKNVDTHQENKNLCKYFIAKFLQTSKQWP